MNIAVEVGFPLVNVGRWSCFWLYIFFLTYENLATGFTGRLCEAQFCSSVSGEEESTDRYESQEVLGSSANLEKEIFMERRD